MLEKYYEFNPDKFYRDYHTNARRLKQLRREQDAIIESGGMDFSRPSVSGGQPGDPTASKVFKRQAIEDKIQVLENYFETADYIRTLLNEEELVIVDFYLCRRGDKKAAMYKCCDRLCIEEPSFYKRLAKLRQKLREIAEF